MTIGATVQVFKKHRFIYHFKPYLTKALKVLAVAFIWVECMIGCAALLISILLESISSSLNLVSFIELLGLKNFSELQAESNNIPDFVVRLMTDPVALNVSVGVAILIAVIYLVVVFTRYMLTRQYEDTCHPIPNNKAISKALGIEHPSFRCSKCCASWEERKKDICPSCKRFVVEENVVT